MVFSSHVFLFYFLPIMLILYYLMVAAKTKISWVNFMVTILSYGFYGWTQPWYVILMFSTSLVNYLCGKEISRDGVTKKRKDMSLLIACVYSMGALAIFKYFTWSIDSINTLSTWFGGRDPLPALKIILPIGISFYTFQAMSYTIDVWRGDAPPVKNFASILCFIAIFPQLIAGPIIRYNTIAQELEVRTHSLEKFTSGMAIFITGFAKKILLANTAALVADAAFRAEGPDAMTAWWGVLGYHFQIYFDFCAYSDMAVGLGRMMGFEFLKNFDAPYRAVSISDFWNRWHVSLSTWIRDYLYISLGGNRKGPKRTYVNLGLSMFLCGLWHGANWTFVIWGVFHGALLIWERTMGRKSIYNRLPFLAKVVLTNMIVMVGWVVFRTPTIEQAMHYWGAMFGIAKPAAAAGLLRAEVFSLHHIIGMALCSLCVLQPVQAHVWVDKLTRTKLILLVVLLFWAVASMFNQDFNPFLYFQF